MKLSRSGPYGILLTREPGEPAVKNESELLHRLKATLQEMGEDVIKKRMWKDGHLVSDEQQYVRSRDVNAPGAYLIYDNQYDIRNSASAYNGMGRVLLYVDGSIRGSRPMIVAFGEGGVFHWRPGT